MFSGSIHPGHVGQFEWPCVEHFDWPPGLELIIGKSNRVYVVLSRKRPLTLAMIRRLHKSLGIPASVLIAETVAG